MNYYVLFGLLVLGIGANAEFNCSVQSRDTRTPTCADDTCMKKIVDHIEFELNAAFHYLWMGALFGQYTIERPGLAKFFLESATEERSHAIQMLDYLNMRGKEYLEDFTFDKTKLWKKDQTNIVHTLTVKQALRTALKMEIQVTEKIHEVITSCGNDFHAADVFTNPIMEEQHTGIRKLQGAIQTLDNLHFHRNRFFSEYVLDQKFLHGEI